MELSDEEINYISKIYQHGINHLVDDTVPNRLICIHNLHWCVEYLLRKATKDYNIDYKAGFEKIFKAFTGKRSVPKDFEKSIFKLNTIRNNMEHREIYPDILVIRKIIPNIEGFIKWIFRIIFQTSIDLRSISSADVDEIFEDFNEWQNGKLAANWLYTSNERSEIYDYIFICLIPATFSPNLVDLAFDGINEMKTSKSDSGVFFSVPNPEHKSKIEHYFRTFRFLFDRGAQVYTVSTHLRYFNDFYGNEMKIFPDGRIYICYEYKHLDKNSLKFNMNNIYDKTGTRYLLNNKQKQLGIQLEGYTSRNLEDIIKIICFAFHPDCKNNIVNIPTKYFQGFFILPFIRYNGKDRILDHSDDFKHIFEVDREYGGDDDDIIYSKTFTYDEIPELVNNFKNWTYGFFRTKADTAFM